MKWSDLERAWITADGRAKFRPVAPGRVRYYIMAWGEWVCMWDLSIAKAARMQPHEWDRDIYEYRQSRI